MKLVGSNKCPTCGKEFLPIPPLRPNVKDREFYGGRVKFFKEVECDCRAKYDLCIEERETMDGKKQSVIDMIVLADGRPLEVVAEEKKQEAQAASDQRAQEAIEDAIFAAGDSPKLSQRNEIKKQQILATIVDRDAKIATLMAYTTHELQSMCRRRKLRVQARWNKKQIAETLLAYDPSVVVANPEG